MSTENSDATTKSAASPTGEISPLAGRLNALMILVALVTVGLTLADVDSDIRIYLAVALFVFGSGSGLVQFLKLPRASLQLGVLVAISVAIDVLLAQVLLWAHNINGSAAVCILAGVTCIRPVVSTKKAVADQSSTTSSSTSSSTSLSTSPTTDLDSEETQDESNEPEEEAQK